MTQYRAPVRSGTKWLRLAGAGVAAAVLYGFDPNTTAVPLCPLHAMTGLWCPFCGSTRAAHALLHLQPATALRDNLLFLLAAPLAGYFAVLWLWSGPRPHAMQRPAMQRPAMPRPAMPRPAMRRLTQGALVAALVMFAVLRNLPVGRWLAPSA